MAGSITLQGGLSSVIVRSPTATAVAEAPSPVIETVTGHYLHEVRT